MRNSHAYVVTVIRILDTNETVNKKYSRSRFASPWSGCRIQTGGP
jgi:hypothetical protein